MIFLQLSCWFLLTVFGIIIKRNNEKLARDSLTNMPIKFIAIENEKASGLSCIDKEKRKDEVKQNADRIAKIDRQSKKLYAIIICIGLFCIASFCVLQFYNTDLEPGSIQSNFAFIVYWHTLISAILTGVMFGFAILLVTVARKENRIMQAF
jgi:hypothetical protein